ncbi:MAG: hypothetical protein COW18_02475 [Zetaproteobacteria bacterium CG12_big_fil_rev_8_21_14_0_65_54_13]|nr:MAG: hypothetical protein AUJ57_10745 [Zetaproteobacteria bacterium CG1_02_53_45]PIP01442.1 MAG: hypothetical protein COX55_10945 [Zetaproteobacteria bacterium CG23_combo_of_CG06-09_8_20_14_all_54_7]PIW51079.1 MAG: hypothetical protein COW18_02475 [Zetaproteobacteria bacterium CG12_big_fil_rev_8_21_14_0_65_54_13]PIX55196.1 MAG: hypothetical protein COZ50_03800 [Zetaproteobacteria bacterium CG_4_10_14_3_um_filter_54_28]PJA28078.1 MAG: hypothetical protein CO188_10465 [Zetaproteobacteria bacte
MLNMQSVSGMAYIRRIGFWAPRTSLIKYFLVHAPIAINDFKRFPLPDSLFFAYYLMRPFSFLLRRLTPTQRKASS